MSAIQGTGYCQMCGRQSYFTKPRVNHVLHLILSIVTLGAWLVVWAVLGALNASKASRCTTCGWQQGRSAGPVRTPAI